jgi:hypothetical protein
MDRTALPSAERELAAQALARGWEIGTKCRPRVRNSLPEGRGCSRQFLEDYRMNSRIKTLLAGAALALSLPVTAASAAGELRDAREQAPAGMIGMWKVDLAASTYAGTKPQAAVRTIAYTEDGKILVSFATLNAAGNLSSGHWAVQVDGTPGIEYHSSAGGLAYNVINVKKVDDSTLHLAVTRHGKLDMEATYKISADGKVLTYSYGKNVLVYRPWNLVN